MQKVLLLCVTCSLALASPNGLALTPPMGWNPYNKYVGAADEKLLRATAAALKSSGLRDLGYR